MTPVVKYYISFLPIDIIRRILIHLGSPGATIALSANTVAYAQWEVPDMEVGELGGGYAEIAFRVTYDGSLYFAFNFNYAIGTWTGRELVGLYILDTTTNTFLRKVEIRNGAPYQGEYELDSLWASVNFEIGHIYQVYNFPNGERNDCTRAGIKSGTLIGRVV